jgi:calcineurin-like phosphoesterase family protein
MNNEKAKGKMKNTLISADPHFDHGNIIKYCRRPFVNDREKELMAAADAGRIQPYDVKISQESIDWMNTTLIDNYNAAAGRDDTLWVIGDVFWGHDYRRARSLRDRINCQTINVICGNHDEGIVERMDVEDTRCRTMLGVHQPGPYRDLFNIVAEQILICPEKQWIFLNHYPMRAWDRSHKGSWMLYGHVHGLYYKEDVDGDRLTVDVGVDSHDFKPWTMNELRRFMLPKMPGFLDRKKESEERRKPSSRKVGPEATP